MTEFRFFSERLSSFLSSFNFDISSSSSDAFGFFDLLLPPDASHLELLYAELEVRLGPRLILLCVEEVFSF
jgi:hypothetical protein